MMEEPYLNLEGQDLVPYRVVGLRLHVCPELECAKAVLVPACPFLPPLASPSSSSCPAPGGHCLHTEVLQLIPAFKTPAQLLSSNSTGPSCTYLKCLPDSDFSYFSLSQLSIDFIFK